MPKRRLPFLPMGLPTRRRIPLATALLIAGTLLIAVGFVRSGVSTGVSSTTYVEAVLGTPQRVNPLFDPIVESERDLVALVFDGLMRLRADGTPEPALVERWEVTPDGLTYTFHIRPGATWHDGAGFDANDVAYTIGRIQSDSFRGSATLQAAWSDVQVFVADSLTVLMRLPEPSADLLVRATLPLLPAHLDEEMGAAGGFGSAPFDRAPVGTGPYRLTRLDDDRAVLEQNSSYYRGTPPIRRIELRFAESAAEQAEMMARGGVHGALLAEGEDAEAIANEADRQTAVMLSDGFTILYVNNTRTPLTNPALRRALTASIDPAAALEVAGVDMLPGDGVIVPWSWAYEAPGEGDEATEPLGTAGLELLWTASQWERGTDGQRELDGSPLTLELVTNAEPSRVAIAEAIAEQLAAQGVMVEVLAVPSQRVISDYLRPGAYDLVLFGWESSPDPDPYTGWHTSQIGAGNVAGFSDPEADALLEVARTTLDGAERIELYRLFQARFEELGASKVIAYPHRVYVYPRNLVGFSPRILFDSSSRFADVHQWWLP